MELYDKAFHTRTFYNLDYKYIVEFDNFFKKNGCKGNTRKYYHNPIRKLYNEAIKKGDADINIYPYKSGLFSIAKLEEKTLKRYIKKEDMDKIKNTIVEPIHIEVARRIFLFLYYCHGISFIDAAQLTKNNIVDFNDGKYIVYQRRKTISSTNADFLKIKINDSLQELLDWFRKNTLLIEDYLLPIVSVPGYTGIALKNHLKTRYTRINSKHLKQLAKILDLKNINLSTYVSRHTMAMTLKTNNVSKDVISQILGHKDLKTTDYYLDSFENDVINKAVNVL